VVLLREAYVALNQKALVRLAERGHGVIRPAHAAVFEYIDDKGTQVARLAERAQVTKQAMAELVAHLERHGYVTRAPDPADRRAKLVTPTPQGQAVFDLMRELVPEIEREIGELLGPRRAASLRRDLERLVSESP
jgi:DNA-binding MarR family transcriptional regulator